MVGRRDFLKASTLVGVGAGVAGCAGRDEGLIIAPASPSLTANDMDAYLARLDRSMNVIATGESPMPKLFPDKKFDMSDPVIKDGDALLRKNLRSLLLVGSFRDLPEEGRAYPGMQSRLWDGMGEMDEAMLGTQKAMLGLTPTERADIGRALKADPDLGMRIVGALDNEAAAVGMPMERRMHLRSLAAHVCARLKQSASLTIEEYTTKVQKVIERPLGFEDVQRQMVALMGESEFFALRDRNFQHVERWRTAQASPEEQTDVFTMNRKKKQNADPGGTTIKVGAILLGVGVVVFGISMLLVEFGGVFPAVFTATAGALMGIGGLITLIVGAIIQASKS